MDECTCYRILERVRSDGQTVCVDDWKAGYEPSNVKAGRADSATAASHVTVEVLQFLAHGELFNTLT